MGIAAASPHLYDQYSNKLMGDPTSYIELRAIFCDLEFWEKSRFYMLPDTEINYVIIMNRFVVLSSGIIFWYYHLPLILTTLES